MILCLSPHGSLGLDDDETPRHKVGQQIHKAFVNPKTNKKRTYMGQIIHYDNDTRYYKVRYEDGDQEEMSHNEVQMHKSNPPISGAAKYKRPKVAKHKKRILQSVETKFAPTEKDEQYHSVDLTVNDIRAIASLKHGI